MKPCIIFCAAGFDGLLAPIPDNALTIAADGGLRHTQALGISPDVILGDFDSLGYVPEGAKVFPVEKDDTDCMLAIRHGLTLGFRRFIIYGGMEGARHDHTLANLQALLYLSQRDAIGYLVGKEQIACAITDSKLVFPEGQGTLSVFAAGGKAGGVTLRGVKYPLEKGTLLPEFPLGVSNRALGQAAVSVETGSLLIFYPRSLGLPKHEFNS